MGQGRVLVVGSINVDLVVSVDRLPAPGETVAGGTFARHGGGKSANQAVAATRLGGEAILVGAVGEDDLGRDALAELAREGVDVARVARLPGVSTGVAGIVVDAAGENQIAVASGANGQLDGARVRAAQRACPEPAEEVRAEGPLTYASTASGSCASVTASPGALGAGSSPLTWIASSTTSSTIVCPALSRPSSTCCVISSSIRCWISRLIGRAPSIGV
jgi:ribokinase